ncbi:hypothetical protein JCM10908_001434 [Rhodotorula pacifica]|uniref:25S rRNA (uracil2634-N3)-methyltransferase n=1 Tax=Rhodotorula pacifica TaxID=1495444 RepID=UPI0031739508
MPKAPKRKGKLATALAGQQQVQQQRQLEERARQAQLDREKAKVLKAAGIKQQQDLKGKKRARTQLDDEGEEHATNGGAGADGEGEPAAGVSEKGPSVQPFKKGERILLVGEGNFSYAHALLRPSAPSEPSSSAATATGISPLVTPSLLCCTAFDSESVASTKYPDLSTHVTALRTAGATVLFGIDATNLLSSKEVRQFAGFAPTGAIRGQGGKKERRRVKGKGRMLEGWANRIESYQEEEAGEDRTVGFDRIVFNFPHVGQGITDQARNIRANQTLLLDFYRSAAPLLRSGKARGLASSASKAANGGKRGGGAGSGSDAEDDEVEDMTLLANGDEQGEAAMPSGLLGDSSMQVGIAAPAAPAPSPYRGTILLTLRTNGPYQSWLPSQLATKPSLLLPSLYPAHELKLRSTAQRGGEQPRFRTVRSWKFEMRWWERWGYEHRRTIGFVEERYGADADGAVLGKNADLAMTARERKLRRIEAAAAAAKAATTGGAGTAEDAASTTAPTTTTKQSRPHAQPQPDQQQQHDIRTWEFELVTPEDEATSSRRSGSSKAGTKRAGAGRAKGSGKFVVGGADDPDLMSD